QAMLCNAPGLVVVAPGTVAGAYELMKTAIASDDPVVFVDSPTLNRESGGASIGDPARPARARIVRPGTDVTLVAVSAMVPRALRVHERLAAGGLAAGGTEPRAVSA